eukprot:sb/3472130/
MKLRVKLNVFSLSEHWPDPILARELWSEHWPDRLEQLLCQILIEHWNIAGSETEFRDLGIKILFDCCLFAKLGELYIVGSMIHFQRVVGSVYNLDIEKCSLYISFAILEIYLISANELYRISERERESKSKLEFVFLCFVCSPYKPHVAAQKPENLNYIYTRTLSIIRYLI